MRALVVLTTSESKALIGKAVAQLKVVRSALKRGVILITRSTTNAFVAEEIIGAKIDKGGFASGWVVPKGLCTNQNPTSDWILIKDGEVQKGISYSEAVDHLGSDDVFIKSANAIDICGGAGILVASSEGGMIGRALGTILARGVNLVIPVGLEKLIPISVIEASKFLGIGRLDYSMGLPVGLVPLHGLRVSEIEAIKILSSSEAFPVAAGGVNGAEGSIVLVIEGNSEAVKKAIEIVESVKGESPIKASLTNCSECVWSNCPKYSGNKKRKKFLRFERGENGKWKEY